MAPRKRKAEQEHEPAPPHTASVRVTRGAAKRGAVNSGSGPVADHPKPQVPEKKKGKKAGKGKQKKEPEKDDGGAAAETKGEGEKTAEDSRHDGDARKKTVVIEHCKQCNSFKTRAIMVKEGLEERVSGITVLLNPEKPRRGCFEIREEGGEIFISLLDMKRPFKPMKDLDMNQVISDIIDKIN